MALGALLGAYLEDDSGGLRALLPLAGRSLLEYQVRCAAAAGAAPIVVMVERVPQALQDAFERLRHDGYGVFPVSDVHELLSFPFMVNRSDRQVTVTGFSVQNVPRGLRVLGYRVLNTNETHGLINVGYLGGGSRKDNVTAYRDYFGKSITVPPRSPSSYYAMVEVRLTGKVRTDLTGCVVHYTTAGERFTQTLGCAYRFRPF